MQGRGVDRELAVFEQGVEGNATTEMDLLLGDIADLLRGKPRLIEFLKREDPRTALSRIAREEGGSEFSEAIGRFFDTYGMRGPSEIDISRPRWREDPRPIIQMLLGNVTSPTARRPSNALRQVGRARPGGRREDHRRGTGSNEILRSQVGERGAQLRLHPGAPQVPADPLAVGRQAGALGLRRDPGRARPDWSGATTSSSCNCRRSSPRPTMRPSRARHASMRGGQSSRAIKR